LKVIRIAHAQGQELFSLHTKAHHTQQQESVQPNCCSRERSSQNFWNLIVTRSEIDEVFRNQDRVLKQQQQNSENSTLTRKEMQKKQKLL